MSGLAALEQQVGPLLRRTKARGRNADARLITKRAAARVLGVNRSTTLEMLIAGGQIRTVPWGNGVRIPISEIERVESEGLLEVRTPPAVVAVHRRPRRTPKEEADAVRRIRIPREE